MKKIIFVISLALGSGLRWWARSNMSGIQTAKHRERTNSCIISYPKLFVKYNMGKKYGFYTAQGLAGIGDLFNHACRATHRRHRQNDKFRKKPLQFNCFFLSIEKFFAGFTFPSCDFTGCFPIVFIFFAFFHLSTFLYIETAQFSSPFLVDNSWILLLFIFAGGWYNFSTIERENNRKVPPLSTQKSVRSRRRFFLFFAKKHMTVAVQ